MDNSWQVVFFLTPLPFTQSRAQSATGTPLPLAKGEQGRGRLGEGGKWGTSLWVKGKAGEASSQGRRGCTLGTTPLCSYYAIFQNVLRKQL